jgi:hypothetical protein
MMAESTMKAPKRRIDPVRWARENLFSSWHNTILTLLVGYLIVTSVGPLLNWVLLDANFQGTDRVTVPEREPAGCLSTSGLISLSTGFTRGIPVARGHHVRPAGTVFRASVH